MQAGNDCPRRHSAICEASGEHGRRCPEPGAELVRRRPDGTIAPGSSGNTFGLKTLRQARKYLAEQTDGNAEVLDILLNLARGNAVGAVPVPASSQVRAAVKLADIIWGKEIRKHVEHSGTVTHEAVVRPALPPGWSNKIPLAELEQFRATLAKVTSEGAEDATFEELPVKAGEEESDD